jgi:putative endonuclease
VNAGEAARAREGRAFAPSLGEWGEHLAAAFLERTGYTILARNWRCRYGELDIVCRDDGTQAIVFVEVKTRTSTYFGAPEEAVRPAKRRRIHLLASIWLRAFDGPAVPVRFDVVAIVASRGAQPTVEHLQGVF